MFYSSINRDKINVLIYKKKYLFITYEIIHDSIQLLKFGFYIISLSMVKIIFMKIILKYIQFKQGIYNDMKNIL